VNRRPPRNGERVKEIKNILIIDGNGLFKVSFHGARDSYNSEGKHIGGIYSFLTTLRKILSEDIYHRVYVFWDGKFSGKLRYEMYPPYKSGRGKDYINGTEPIDLSELEQRKIIWDYINEMHIRQLMDDVVESDDFIAYCCLSKKENEKITIVSGDRDFLQLISNDIRIYFLDIKQYVDLSNYSSYFCYHPCNGALIKILTGDTSDSIKGIKGLGETKLLSLFPELKDRQMTLSEIIDGAKLKQKERIDKKQPPLKVLDNIINGITDGVQKERVYEINDKLVNLKRPLLNENALRDINNLIDGDLASDTRDIKNVFSMMKRDGIDDAIGSIRYPDFLTPFKKLKDRENIFNN